MNYPVCCYQIAFQGTDLTVIADMKIGIDLRICASGGIALLLFILVGQMCFYKHIQDRTQDLLEKGMLGNAALARLQSYVDSHK